MTINELKGITEIKPVTPMTADKSRIDALKRSKDVASKNLSVERDRQKIASANRQIASVKANATAAI